MRDRWDAPWLSAIALLTAGLALWPGVASAHDVATSRLQTPLPLSWLFAGAGATVALTALWLAVTERTPESTTPRTRVLTIPATVATPLRVLAAGIFLAGVVVALVAGFAGRQVAAENFATVFTWPLWFRGLALLAIVFGTPWRTLSPFRRLYDGLDWLEGESFALVSYPSALAEWPAVVGFLAVIGIVENLTVIPATPRLTAVLIAGYALAMVGGATLFGRAWLRRGDPMGVFYRLFGRLAPVEFGRHEDGGYTVAVTPPWAGCLDPVGNGSLVVFVIATVYTVSFDGFTDTRAFQTVLFDVRHALGTGPETSIVMFVVGFAGFVCTFAAGSWLVERLGATASGDWAGAARSFAPTVLPIAAAYEVAHNYPYVLRNLGQLPAVAGHWVAPAVGPIDLTGWLSLSVFWGSQVVLIVLGHVVAVVAAHNVAVERYDSQAAARRGHLPLVALMVGYTVLSLWIISQPVIA